MNIIEELWYGNISPCERDFKKGSKFSECTNEMYGIAEREAFARGFVLRVRSIIAVVNTEIE